MTAYWLEDVLQEQKLRPPWLAYHFPSPYEIKTGPLTNHVIKTFIIILANDIMFQ